MTDDRRPPDLWDVGRAAVWLTAWPIRRIWRWNSSEEIRRDARRRPDDELSAHLVNVLRAWAWGIVGACWVVPTVVLVNLVRTPLTRDLVVFGFAVAMTNICLSGIRAGVGRRYGERIFAGPGRVGRRLVTPSNLDLVFAVLVGWFSLGSD